MKQTVLLVAATGMFGNQIARHLVDQPDASVRLLMRPTEDPKKKDALKPSLDRGAELVQGDLSDCDSLDRATRGVDVIVSAVAGGPEVIIDGQVALAEAAKRNGVRRILRPASTRTPEHSNYSSCRRHQAFKWQARYGECLQRAMKRAASWAPSTSDAPSDPPCTFMTTPTSFSTYSTEISHSLWVKSTSRPRRAHSYIFPATCTTAFGSIPRKRTSSIS